MRESKPQIYDISVAIYPALVTWPGDPKPRVTVVKTIAEGGSSNLSEIAMGSHTGTHVDAPAHFADGAATIDQVPLEILVGPAKVVDMTGRAVIRAEDLRKARVKGSTRLLLKTDNSKLWADSTFHEKFTYIDPKAAKYIVEAGVKLVGVDYLSVERPHTATHPTHHAFLDAGVVIIEGLNLAEVKAGRYELICLPLKVTGAEAAPARVALRRARRARRV